MNASLAASSRDRVAGEGRVDFGSKQAPVWRAATPGGASTVNTSGEPFAMNEIRDAYCRRINYLRVSVTDRCNFRCLYCMPDGGFVLKTHKEILSYEEIARLVRVASELGVSKVRLTGGEPLVRYGVVDLVRSLASLPGVDDLSLTTNGALLPRYARGLKEAGLQRINVSLDTLIPERFTHITRRGCLEEVMAGIAAAETAGLEPIKLNTVVVRGFNDDEVAEIARLTLTKPWHVRFIELMPVGSEEGCLPGVCDGSSRGHSFVPVAEMRQRIEAALGALVPDPSTIPGNGPARYYRLDGAMGSVGFISAVSEHFCDRCNRLRLTADGALRTCLMADGETDLRTPLRSGAGDDELRALIIRSVAEKPERHHLGEHQRPLGRAMAQIGG
jgi:cyclic pyranopterin phosphate synthase